MVGKPFRSRLGVRGESWKVGLGVNLSGGRQVAGRLPAGWEKGMWKDWMTGEME